MQFAVLPGKIPNLLIFIDDCTAKVAKIATVYGYQYIVHFVYL